MIMATFVLIHGAWHGGWCYCRVARILRTAGHEVFTPTLTGLGERCHLATTDTNLDTHITDVLNVIKWEDLGNVVLCGHSYGGIVVTGVADALPDKVTAVVYLDPYLPQDGETMMSHLTKERRDMFLRDATENHGGVSVTAPDVSAFSVNDVDKDWVRSMLTPHPLASFQQPIRLTGAYKRLKRTFVYTKGEVISRPYYEMFFADPTWTVLATNQEGTTRWSTIPSRLLRSS